MKKNVCRKAPVLAVSAAILILNSCLALCALNTAVISDFEDIKAWKTHKSSNEVGLKISKDSDSTLKVEYDFTKSKGYIITMRGVNIKLPENYYFSFLLKGKGKSNNLEFKLDDRNGNTFWRKYKNFTFPDEFKKIIIKRDDIVFAWGPKQGAPLEEIKSLEIAVSCGQGGSGAFWVDDLKIVELPPAGADIRADFRASAQSHDSNYFEPKYLLDGKMDTKWKARWSGRQWIKLNTAKPVSLAGLELIWDSYAAKYDIFVSKNGSSWEKVYETSDGDGGSDMIYFPVRKNIKFVRIDCKESASCEPFSLYEIKLIPEKLMPRIKTSSNNKEADYMLDSDISSSWTSSNSGPREIRIDFGKLEEIGGVTVLWGKAPGGIREVYVSENGKIWEKTYSSSREIKTAENIYFRYPEQARYIKINVDGKNGPVTVNEIIVRRFNEKISPMEIAAIESPKGFYPRWLSGEQEYWTLSGVVDDDQESLITEDGTVEPWHYSFTLAPFIKSEKRLITYANTKTEQKLEEGYIPMPGVVWRCDGIDLLIDVFSADSGMKSSTYLTYTIVNKSGQRKKGGFYLALRPFQASAPIQGGGFADVEAIDYLPGGPKMMKVNGNNALFVAEAPDTYGTHASGTEESPGDVVQDIVSGTLKHGKGVFRDSQSLGSAALGYKYDLEPGGSRSFYFIVPLHGDRNEIDRNAASSDTAEYFAAKRALTKKYWNDSLGRINICLPEKEFVDTLKANVAYVLLNDDNCRLQPGSRNYEKSWMRDGAVTARALLAMGFDVEVKRYLNWISGFIKDDGWVPFIVDNKDQIVTFGWKEFDSQGEYIYAINQYYQFTKDKEFLLDKKQKISDDIKYMQMLRAQRKTAEFLKPEKAEFYGIFPESASHEGYADSPKHSYWDDFWGIRGLKDAELIFQILGDKKAAAEAKEERIDFQKDFYNSMDIVVKKYGITMLPACAEARDTDPTSTAIGVWPCDELDNMPKGLTLETFELYWKQLTSRDGSNWTGSFTPYELRNLNPYILMGQKDRLYTMLKRFLAWKRPRSWNHWAEVVVSNPRSLHYLGDMPHTWVGTEYINAVRNMLILDEKETLVLGKGIVREWCEPGNVISVTEMPTHFGKVSYSVDFRDNAVYVDISGNLKGMKDILFELPPVKGEISEISLNGKSYAGLDEGCIKVGKTPAKIIIGVKK